VSSSKGPSPAWGGITTLDNNRAAATTYQTVEGPGDVNFIAMQYYALILNRTLLLYARPDGLYGTVIAALRSTPGYMAPASTINPARAVRQAVLRKAQTDPSARIAIRVSRDDIAGVSTNLRTKWGMGSVPYSGRILVQTKGGQTFEFILLGLQDVEGQASALRRLWGLP
jgi:hypothetical protein